MKSKIIRIGNSQGIRIPKPVLEQSGLGEDHEVELTVEPNQITIRPVHRPRRDWAEAFKGMSEHGDDVLLDPEGAATSSWDDEEWEW